MSERAREGRTAGFDLNDLVYSIGPSCTLHDAIISMIIFTLMIINQVGEELEKGGREGAQ